MDGIRSTNLERQFVIDELLGNITADGVEKTARVPFAYLAHQLAGTGAFIFGNMVFVATKAQLEAVTPDRETAGGVVLADTTAANNGYYYRSGGAWVRGRGFPDTFARVELAGTANAQTAAVDSGVSPSAVEVFFAVVTTTNTGPMTLSVSGETPRDVVNAAGNALAAGEWTGVVLFFLNDGGDYQLLVDAGAAASAAASATLAGQEADRSKTEADRAEAARDAAIAAGANEFAATRTALKALDTATYTHVYLTEAGREGQFTWRFGDYSSEVAADPQEGFYVKADAVLASAGAWVRSTSDRPNAAWWGLSDASADNQTTGQAALDFAKAEGRALRIPTGTYDYSGTLKSEGRMLLEGDGMDSAILRATGTVAAAAFMIDMAAGDYDNVTGHRCRDFQIAVENTTDRTMGFHIRLASGVFLSNFVIEDVRVAETQGWGLFLDNTAANHDGFFVSTIRRCVFYNGVYAPNLGDNINFEQNQVTAGESGTNPALYFEGVSGARQYVGRENNLTCRGGAAVLIGTDQTRFENNQCEHGWWYGDGAYTGAFASHVYVADCLQPKIIGNTMNPFYNFEKPITTVSGRYDINSNVISQIASTALINAGDIVTSPDGLLPSAATVIDKTATTITVDVNATSTAIADVVVTRRINTNAAASTITIDGATNEALIEDNDIEIGRFSHIEVAASAKNTRIGQNRYYGSLTPEITDSGQGTMGVEKTVASASLLNGWATFAAGTEIKYTKSTEGRPRVRGSGTISSGALGAPVFQFPIGFRPARKERFSAETFDGAAYTPGLIDVFPDGNVYVVAGGVTEVSLKLDFYAPLVA